jgi:hypothetical protein
VTNAAGITPPPVDIPAVASNGSNPTTGDSPANGIASGAGNGIGAVAPPSNDQAGSNPDVGSPGTQKGIVDGPNKGTGSEPPKGNEPPKTTPGDDKKSLLPKPAEPPKTDPKPTDPSPPSKGTTPKPAEPPKAAEPPKTTTPTPPPKDDEGAPKAERKFHERKGVSAKRLPGQNK